MQYALFWLAARKLGLADFGVFTFALSASYLVSQFADLGLQLYVQRELATLTTGIAGEEAQDNKRTMRFTDERKAASLVGGGLILKAGLAVISMALLVGITLWEPVGNRGPVLLIGVAAVLLTGLDYLAYCYRALGKLSEEARAYGLGRFINLLLGVVLLQVGAALWGVAIAAFLAAVIAVGYSYRRFLRYLRPAWHLDVARWRPVLAQPLMIGAGIALSMVAFRVDNLLIPFFVRGTGTDEALSLYNAAYKLFELTLVMPATILAAGFALLSSAAAARDDTGSIESRPLSRFKRVLGQLVLSLVVLGALASLVLGLGAAPLTQLLYGETFAPSVAILQLLALGCLPMYASYGLTHALIALRKPHAYALAALAALCTNVVVNLFLLPRMGTAGAALATFCTELVMVAICGSAVFRILRAESSRVTVRSIPPALPALEERV